MISRTASSTQFELGGLIERLSGPRLVGKRVSVRRPDDHLVLELFFENLRVEIDERDGARLIRVEGARAPLLIVEFPAQSFAEEAFPVERKEPPSRAWVRMSGGSRLAFSMPAGVEALPFTLAAVLQAMQDWPLRLDAHALPSESSLLGLPDSAHATVSGLLVAQVEPAERAEVANALVSGARRIAELAAGGLPSGEVADVVWGAIRQEAATLVKRHPQLAEGDLHTGTLAALALGSAANLKELAESARIGRDDTEVAQHLPYLSLLLATPREPARNATALELPYRLFLSPIGEVRWEHRLLPRAQHGRTELWHTRLESASASTDSLRVRALWSPDVDRPQDTPFLMSLTAQDRGDLVRLMADWNQKRLDGRAYHPEPGSARRLHLSSLGALLDAGGDWPLRPKGVDVEQWRHAATLGRDQYVRIVRAGYLVPFGHAASYVEVTERKFVATKEHPERRMAILRKRGFILVKERVRRYAGLKAEHQWDGRNFPFTEVEVLTHVTPDVTQDAATLGASPVKEKMGPPKPSDSDNGVGLAFWPQIPGADGKIDFQFDVAATDLSGERIRFSLPMLFVGETVNAENADNVRKAYTGSKANRRSAELGGASIVYDQGPSAKPADSRLSTVSASFKTEGTYPVSVPAFPQAPNFFPELERTYVNVPSLQKILGRNEPLAMTYPVVKNASDFDNPGGVFLWADQGARRMSLGFGAKSGGTPTDALGGLASPEMSIVALSSVTGPVSGDPKQQVENAVKAAKENTFDPGAFFQGAKLLGGIDLGSIVRTVTAGLGSAPRFSAAEVGRDQVTSFDFVTELDDAPMFKPGPNSKLEMHGKVTTPLDGKSAPRREATAELGEFKLELFEILILSFEHLKFQAKPGQKPDITVRLAAKEPVLFGGPLEFVNALREHIPSNGFSDPPSLSITPNGISAGFSLGLPIIGVGIFTLSNVSLGCSFSLPFDTRPISVRFNFSERERPFSLTVSGLGGGGFFALAIGTQGVQEIEAALEFGAAVAINLGVASGLVEIKAGIYFHCQDDGKSQSVVLAGYVRLHGELTVLAIASASLTFNLQLGFEKANGVKLVFGEATLVVSIEVLFLSSSVSVHCRREFSGGPADPKFIDLIPNQAIWDEYCAAFAEEAA